MLGLPQSEHFKLLTVYPDALARKTIAVTFFICPKRFLMLPPEACVKDDIPNSSEHHCCKRDIVKVLEIMWGLTVETHLS